MACIKLEELSVKMCPCAKNPVFATAVPVKECCFFFFLFVWSAFIISCVVMEDVL